VQGIGNGKNLISCEALPNYFGDLLQMKKTLVALAVAAISGASFGQSVQMSGSLSMGFKATTAADAAGTQKSGSGVDQSEINFSVKQKIDATQSVEAKLGLAGADRSGESTAVGGGTNSGAAFGRDASITYTNTRWGQVKLSASEGSGYFSSVGGLGLSGQGQPLIEMDSKLHERKASSDSISYTAAIGPVYVQLEHSEPASDLGLGGGSTGSGGHQRKTTYSAYYPADKLTLLAVFRTYDNQIKGACTASDCPAIYATKDNLYNLQGSYDFGVVKVGAGYQYVNASAGMHQIDSIISAAVPMGPLTLAASYYTSKTTDVPDTSAFANIGAGGAWDAKQYAADTSGYSVGAKYDLSKNFSLTARYASWTPSGYARYEADGDVKPAMLQKFGAAYAAYAAAPSAATQGALAQAWGAAANASAGLKSDKTATEASLLLTYSF
jgi:hypothetical protein